MSLRLLKIVVYGHRGQKREVTFNAHGLSIVTGGSKTGKSSLIDIVDYCTGRETCNVADGVIRRAVSWYGVLFDRGDVRIFVARRNPPVGEVRNSDVYLEVGAGITVPELARLEKNTTVDGIETYLTSMLGISENMNIVPEGQTRLPLSANIRHALLFSFQDQGEIDSKKVLFHRQDEPFMPQAIKDVLPYFLGAIDEESLRRQAELDREKKELRKLERRATEVDDLETLAARRVSDIYREAQAAGLVPAGPVPTASIALDTLRSIGPVVAEGAVEPDIDPQLTALRKERASLRTKLLSLREELRQAERVESVAGGFLHEAREQRARLAHVEILPKGAKDAATCILCGSKPANPAPRLVELRDSLKDLSSQLEMVQREAPRLQALQRDLLHQGGRTENELRENQRRIDALFAMGEKFRTEQDRRVQRAVTAGRVGYFLETMPAVSGRSDDQEALERLRKKINALGELLDPDAVRERIASFMSFIGDYMTDYSRSLDLEHTGSRLRLDLRALAVVADTIDGPVPLFRMGSGENWVGYHVLAHLALHKWFRKKSRPVTAFLVFDQPSQAHYPADRDNEGDVSVLGDSDREAVYKLFKLIADVAAELSPGFQIIVVDHADLKDEWFSNAVVERWRRSRALIPADWLS